jgi:integrase
MAWVIERKGAKGTSYMGCYRDPAGKQRTAGSFTTRRAAERAAVREELKVNDGHWHDPAPGKVTFRDYVQTAWLPSRHIEPSTLAGYQSYLNRQFYPFFGALPMNKILPSDIQEWVTTAANDGLSPTSIRKYHMMLHSVFRRAVRDRIITFNPCEETELPKVVTPRRRTLTPDEYRRVLAAIPDKYRLMVQVAIETGLRWGELIALRPRHLDFTHRTLTVEETIVEVPKRATPNGDRMIVKPYPKDNEWRRMGLRPALLDQLRDHIREQEKAADDLLFATRDGTPISRNTFRTRAWTPAIKASGVDFPVRIHDLRHAHASWLLAGGADLKSVMDRMGHSLIQTTQKYLHTLPDADQRNLDAFTRIADT